MGNQQIYEDMEAAELLHSREKQQQQKVPEQTKLLKPVGRNSAKATLVPRITTDL